MADVSYRPNNAGVGDYANGPEIKAVVLAIAEIGKAYATSISPSSTEAQRREYEARYGTRSGDKRYATGFSVSEITVRFASGPRAAAQLLNDSPHAAAVEFGNRSTPRGHHVLARTAAHLGGSA